MFKKVIFFALNDTFDFDQIGGTDSYMRRLSRLLIGLGLEVVWVFYGSEKYSKVSCEGVSVVKFESFQDALKYTISGGDSYLVACFLKPLDRFRMIKYRTVFRKHRIKLLSLSFFFPDTFVKKLLRMLELKLVKYDDVLCVSKRLYRFNKGIIDNSHYLPPIIPDSYFNVGFLKLSNKDKEKVVKALFLGRLDPRKGINEVISVIESDTLTKQIRWTVSGIYIPEDPGNIAALNRLKACDNVTFNQENRGAFSENVENRVLNFFLNNDIFIQPYRTLASTVDLPLLLLEAQAAGCTTLTTLPEVLNNYLYDKSEAIGGDFVTQCINRLNGMTANPMAFCLDEDGLVSLQLEYSEKSIEKRLREILNG
mgnify:CR=1 FL=1